MLYVGVLGPMEVCLDGRPVALTTGRLRALLAVLAMSAGRAVTVNRLAAAVWGNDLPGNVRRSVQTYVVRLRRALGSEAIRTCRDGYLLHTDRVDALQFVRLLDDAAAAPDGDQERAGLLRALALWRGTPFEGVRAVWLEEVAAPRLVERYLGAVERRIDLDLTAGRHGDVLGELRDLTVRYPLRERFWGQLMTALYRSGRQGDALETYQRLYRLLATEVGVAPGAAVRQIHHLILSGDTALHSPVRPDDDAVPVPRQLPAGVGDFCGRSESLDRLDSLVRRAGDTAAISVITGGAGVGKTALAVHWAHRAAGEFPDGQLYLNLRGFDSSGQPLRPVAAIHGFLQSLGVPAAHVPGGLEAKAGLYRSLLAGKRVLVLLDNARDADQVRPLLPGAPGCATLVTSRHQLPGLVADGAHTVTLDVLSAGEARQLLAHRLGHDRVAAEPEATERITTLCARLPLALAIVAARATMAPRFSLAELAAELADSLRDQGVPQVVLTTWGTP